MSKTTLVIISALRDVLDLLIVGQIPVLNIIVNVPVMIAHYWYAGPVSLLSLIENVTGVETLPCFTALALAYPSKNQVVENSQSTQDKSDNWSDPVANKR